LHDFFVIHGDGFILIDCESGLRAQDLYDRLNKYRLRANVKISIEKENNVYGILECNAPQPNFLQDPRHFKMGYRVFEKPENMNEEHFEEWDQQRLILSVPDGSRDMVIERSTLLECNIDKMNGVDFDKGCYMGQELTARMHHRNLGKKHLQTLKFNGMPPPAPLSDVHLDGVEIGSMRSSCGNIGLALIKDAHLERLRDAKSDNPICLLG